MFGISGAIESAAELLGYIILQKKWLIKCPVGICRHLIDGAHLAVFSVFSSMVPLIKQTDKQKTYKV